MSTSRPTDRVPDDVIRASMRETAKPVADGWMRLGVCPAPRTTWETIRYHAGHGLVMGYPLLRILWFAWRNRRSWRSSLGDPAEQQLREAWADGYRFAQGVDAREDT